jgi:hypothetical protein
MMVRLNAQQNQLSECRFNRARPVPAINSRKLIATGEAAITSTGTGQSYANCQRIAGIEHFDSWDERDANAVAQPNQLEPKLTFDLEQHLSPAPWRPEFQQSKSK